jgi:hypothetical protein
VGLRRWFLPLLSSGQPPDADPDALIDLLVVPLASVPMLLAALEQRGIDAVGIESFDVVTDTRSRMRIMVHRREFTAASEVADRFG